MSVILPSREFSEITFPFPLDHFAYYRTLIWQVMCRSFSIFSFTKFSESLSVHMNVLLGFWHYWIDFCEVSFLLYCFVARMYVQIFKYLINIALAHFVQDWCILCHSRFFKFADTVLYVYLYSVVSIKLLNQCFQIRCYLLDLSIWFTYYTKANIANVMLLFLI